MSVDVATKGQTKGVFVANRWSPAQSGRTLDVVAPAEGKPFTRIAAGDAADIDAAVGAARRAMEGAWGKMPAAERGRLLSKLGAAISDHAEELTLLEARDTGKPMKQAKADIAAAARYFEFYGGAADKFHGETLPFLPGYFVPTERVPLGVTGHIIPWNYPAQMFGRTLGPTLAVGNAAVVKPAEDACLTPLRLAELSAEVGFRRGRDQRRPGPWRRGRRRSGAAQEYRFHFVHRIAGGRHADPDRCGQKSHRLYARTRRKVAATRFRRR